jgi:hypothetical protein
MNVFTTTTAQDLLARFGLASRVEIAALAGCHYDYSGDRPARMVPVSQERRDAIALTLGARAVRLTGYQAIIRDQLLTAL